MGKNLLNFRLLLGLVGLATTSFGAAQGSGTALDFTTIVLVDGLSLERNGQTHQNNDTTYQLQLGDVVTARAGSNAPYPMILPDASVVVIPAGTQFRVESDDRGVETYAVLRGSLHQFRGALNPGKVLASREFGLESDRYTTDVPNQFADTLYSHNSGGSVHVVAGNVRLFDPYGNTFAMMSGSTDLYASATYRNRVVVVKRGSRLASGIRRNRRG
jgi:hypothetical protein